MNRKTYLFGFAALTIVAFVVALLLANREPEPLTLEEFIETCGSASADYGPTITVGFIRDDIADNPIYSITPPEMLWEYIDATLEVLQLYEENLSTFHPDTQYAEVIRLGGTEEYLDAVIRWSEVTLAIPEPAYTAMAEAGCIRERPLIEEFLAEWR